MQKKVLVVDDDPVQLKLLQGVLTGKGFDVVVSSEAADGLQQAMMKSPDLIILDVMMPIINGYNFCKLLKSQSAHKHIPVLFLTSRADADDIKIGQEMGAEGYLTKPVDTQELLGKIRELLKIGKE